MEQYIPNENKILHKTQVDLTLSIVQKVIYLVQYDKSLPVIEVELFNNNEKYYLFHPNDAGNIAFIKCLDNEYIFLETYVINMNYDIQPLPLCITGLLLQKKLC